MKNFFCAALFVVTLTLANTCAAADVWVDRWDSEGVDLYAMDETITSGTSATGKYFSVSTKMIGDGQRQRVVKWTFSKWQDDMWRYETDSMDGTHTTVVIPRSPLFEFCMDRLGWSYEIEEHWYY